jgi:phosphodiesterase/alkaline phosphatase D-like protein
MATNRRSIILFFLASLIILARPAFAGSLLVSWDAVQDARVAGYKIKYGTTLGSYTQSVSVGNVTSYTVGNLTEGSNYYMVVGAYDASQLEGILSAPISAVVLRVSSAAASSVTHNSAVISWQSNKASDSQVSYGTSAAYGSSSPSNSTMVTSHSVTLSGLSASTTYHYQVRSRDQGGSTSVLGDFTFTTVAAPDTTLPIISGAASSNVTPNAATINWTTNEASDTQVDYGTTTAYGSSTVLNPTMVTTHSASLSGLTASKTYHYRVKSKDAAGNLATSADFTFATTAAPDTTPPTISGVASSGVTSSGATITWTTNEPSDTQVEYGPTTAYGSLTTLNSSPVTSHSQTLAGLSAGTIYHYRVRSKDAAGSQSVSGDFTFTTVSPLLPAPTNVNVF